MSSDRQRKCLGRFTEPDFPPRTLIRAGRITIENFYRSEGDHAPPHLHLIEIDCNIAIGQNGEPLEGYPELTKAQKEVVQKHRTLIRKAIRQIGRWYWFHNLAEKEFEHGS